MPIIVAPMSQQRMAHDEGELAVAKAVAKAGTAMVSTVKLHQLYKQHVKPDNMACTATNINLLMQDTALHCLIPAGLREA